MVKLRELLGLGGGTGPYTVIPVKVWLPVLVGSMALGTFLSRSGAVSGWLAWTAAFCAWAVGLGIVSMMIERRERADRNTQC